MKPTLTPNSILLQLLFFTFFLGVVHADPTCTNDNTNTLTVCEESTTCEDNPCYPPNWTNTYNIYQTSATWAWESCYGATGYHIQWRYPGGSWYDVPGVCYQTWYQMNNLQPCTNYEWRVRSYCSYGYYSSWCYPYYFTTQCYNCYTPHGCYTDNITENSAYFHWNSIWGAQYYHVQLLHPNGYWVDLSGSCYNNYYHAYNLQPNTYYAWRVRAHCGYNNYSDWTYHNYFTTYGNHCYYPSWLNCYDISDHSATWKWEPVSGAQYYTIQWRQAGGSWYDLSSGPVYGTWITVHHLNPCTTYEWRVRSHCHYGYSSWCYPNVFTTICHSYCPVPGSLSTKDIGDTKATFKWAPVNGAHSYSVQIRKNWGQWVDVPGSPTAGIWITAYNLSPCTHYEWRVRANCGHYESSSNWSYPQSFTTTCGHGCYAPEWLYTTGISSSSAVLHWGNVIGADYYEIQWRGPGQDWATLSGTWTGTVAEIGGLDPNTTYEWRVRAHCTSGNFSNWSSITYFVTQGRSCGLPFFRYTHPITDSTATLNWSAVPDAINYSVQIRVMGGDWADVPNSPTTGTSIMVTGLMPITTYEWRMRVNCANSTSSTWMSAIMFNTGGSNGCATPTNLSADSITLTSAILSWNEVPGAESYSVEYRSLPNGNWTLIPGSQIDTNFVLLDSLIPLRTFEWRVRANCEGGLHSFYSQGSLFTTTDLPPCGTPHGLHTESVTENSAVLNWSPVAGALGYQIQIRFPNGVWIDIDSLIADTSYLVSGLASQSNYEWRVRSKCDTQHFSNWSHSVGFTTGGSGGLQNDDCINAITLAVDTTCTPVMATNINATQSSPSPMGGCPSDGSNDVWFKFNMPDVANPAVTIRTSAGSLANAVMEVYSGTDCNILSLITCEDNNDNGNGSTMPVVNLTGTPNATIWVRVWGLGGATGTFTICVFDHISFDYTVIPESVDAAEGVTINTPETIKADNSEIEESLFITPNPASDRLNINVQLAKDNRVVEFRMVDLSGKVMIRQDIETTLSAYQTEFVVSSLVPGMYLLQVQTTRGMMMKKVMVIR